MTLLRVLEAEVMDSIQEAVDYDSMDHSAVNRAFVDDLVAAGLERGDVLDVGTGTALIPIELCRRLEQVDVWAIDAAEAMLDLAKANLVLAGLIERIRLEWVDAKELPYEQGRFQAVISNSIVHHVADPRPVLRQALRVAAPGGLLFFRDLVRPDDEAAVRQLVETYASGANEHQRHLFEASLRPALTVDEVRELVKDLGLSPDEVKPTSDRHWTWITRK